jgi:hypothetical protein
MLDLFSVSVVLLRTIAFFAIFEIVVSIPGIFHFIKQIAGSEPPNVPDMLAIAATVLAQAIGATLLLIYSKRVARSLTRGLDGSSISLEESNYPVLQAVSFSLLGMYILVHAFPVLAKMTAIYLLPDVKNPNEHGLFSFDFFEPKQRVLASQVTEVLAEIALGLWLVLGSRGIVRLIRPSWERSLQAKPALPPPEAQGGIANEDEAPSGTPASRRAWTREEFRRTTSGRDE